MKIDPDSLNVLRQGVVCYGDGLSTKRSLECVYLRQTDQFGNLKTFKFAIGGFHFVWYCLMINHQFMWNFGYGELAILLKKHKKVQEHAKRFTQSDSFFVLVWTSFLWYSLDMFGQQYIELGLEESWGGYVKFMKMKAAEEDQLRR